MISLAIDVWGQLVNAMGRLGAHLLLEDGGNLLIESGGVILLEDGSESTIPSMTFSNTNNSAFIELLQNEFIL